MFFFHVNLPVSHQAIHSCSLVDLTQKLKHSIEKLSAFVLHQRQRDNIRLQGLLDIYPEKPHLVTKGLSNNVVKDLEVERVGVSSFVVSSRCLVHQVTPVVVLHRRRCCHERFSFSVHFKRVHDEVVIIVEVVQKIVYAVAWTAPMFFRLLLLTGDEFTLEARWLNSLIFLITLIFLMIWRLLTS